MRALLIRIAFTATSFSIGLLASAQDGVALLHKMQAALGGADRIAAIKDFEQIVRAESWNGNTGASLGEVRKRTRWLGPNHLRVDQLGPGSTYVLSFDGTEGWEILPGTQQAVPIAGGELQFAKGYVRGFFLLQWLADRLPDYRITSPAPNVLRISHAEAGATDFTLDPSGLPVKSAFISLSDPSRPTSGETSVLEWETVQGVRFPKHWQVLRSGIRVAEATVEQTRLNQGLKLEDLVAKPADGKAVFPHD